MFTISFPQDGRPDRSFFSADCFHLSQKSQTLMARSLWNNMVSIRQEEAFTVFCACVMFCGSSIATLSMIALLTIQN